MNPHDSQGNQICDSRGEIYPTLRACAWGFDPSTARDVGTLFFREMSKTLTNGSCPGHHNGVLIVYE